MRERGEVTSPRQRHSSGKEIVQELQRVPARSGERRPVFGRVDRGPADTRSEQSVCPFCKSNHFVIAEGPEATHEVFIYSFESNDGSVRLELRKKRTRFCHVPFKERCKCYKELGD